MYSYLIDNKLVDDNTDMVTTITGLVEELSDMRDDSESRARNSEDSPTSLVESMSENAIRRELKSVAIQHPTTIIPAAIAVLSVVSLALLPDFIPFGLAILVLILSALVSTGSFVWIYSFRHDSGYAKLVEEIMATHGEVSRAMEEAEVSEMRGSLTTGFSDLESEAGLKALAALDYEYEQLRLVLERHDDIDAMSLSHIPALADETYQQGLNVLSVGLQLSQAIHTSNRERLEHDIEDLEKEIHSLKQSGSDERRIEIRRETVVSHQERLVLINDQQTRVDEVLYQCDQCEASLAKTRIELASLQAGTLGSSVSSVTETLQKTIDQAKDIQEELRRLGF